MSTKQLSEQAQAISAALQAELEGSDFSARVSKDNTVYKEHAEKAGYTMDVIDGVKSYDRTFAAATMDATSAVALKAVQEGLKAEAINVSFAGAKGESFDVQYTPEKHGTMPGQDGQPDKPWSRFGKVRVAHTTTASGKSGDLGAAIALAQAAAEAVLKKA